MYLRKFHFGIAQREKRRLSIPGAVGGLFGRSPARLATHWNPIEVFYSH